MPAIGYVTRQEDGSFKGQLRTLSIRADIEIFRIARRTPRTSPITVSLPIASRSARRGGAPVETPALLTSL